MKMIFLFSTLALCFLLPRPGFSQGLGMEIEVDPIAYILSGYSFHLGEYVSSWKFDVNTASEQFNQSETKSLLSNSNFTTKFTSYGAKLDYIGVSQVGIHVGLQWDYMRWTYTNVSNAQKAKNTIQDLGVRIGYRFGSGAFYLDPWIALLYNFQGTDSVAVAGQSYRPQHVQVFPTVHLGWRF
jgi:hypothetical protein